MARARAAELLQQEGVRLVIGWSRGEQNSAEYARLTGARCAEDWRAVIDEQEVQAVCIGTPTSTHVQYAVAAMEAGKHVLVECPATVRLSEFDRMVETAERSGVVFYAGSNYRFDTWAQALDYASQKLGRMLLAAGDSTWMPRSPWYRDRALSGGVFPCVHLYQFTLFSALGRALWVTAELSREGDYGVAMVGYDGGATALATGGFERHGPNEFIVVGTEGMMRRQVDGSPAIVRGREAERIPTSPLRTTREDNAVFVRCIRGEEDWRTRAQAEREVHAVAVGAQDSAERSERIVL